MVFLIEPGIIGPQTQMAPLPEAVLDQSGDPFLLDPVRRIGVEQK